MTALRFYEHFACAYGTFWFGAILLSIVTQSHINTGEIGFFGFPILALIYAVLRACTQTPADSPKP